MKTYEPLNVLKPIDDNIWMVDGPIIRMDFPLGFKVPFPTRMAVVRLGCGGLWVHSPIAADPSLIEAVTALGPVKYLLATNSLHYWYVPEWAELFPEAIVFGPSGLMETAKRPLQLDREFGALAESEWCEEIDQLLFIGSVVTEAVFLHRSSKTLIVSDLIENFEPAMVEERFLRWVMARAGILDPHGSMPVDLRMTFWKNRGEILTRIDQLLAWQPERVIMAHGRPYLSDGAAELRRAFRWADRFR